MSRVSRGQRSFEFRTRGGKRKGAGRKPRGPRSSEAHRRRPEHDARQPVHVILRIVDEVRRVRCRPVFYAIQRALLMAIKNVETFRICHISIQNRHIHLICEARDRDSLALGVKGFSVSCARRINQALGRRGQLFADRYHAVPITSPRQCWNCVRYVNNNWRHHREDRGSRKLFDRYSSGPVFWGWDRGMVVLRADAEVLPVAYARTWMLTEGLKKHGPMSPWDRP